ncbi:C4-dicarboxylate TRAP transporter substrate-binding protein [uncultured Albimonas sp.]|uniref:C4-dicarboxylate TRAP transporter substrate-binding protein n=1 Tax=uncultured Albimonas sp. TaxID=1331701 RepID=UPI0030EEA948|tara:strand:- start:5931 stop:7064 length:1134 start_codon:yes stop_codon:yes gene_type:complete
MITRHSAGRLCAAAVCALGALGALAAAPASAKELRIVIGAPGESSLQLAMRMFAEKIEENTGGEYTGKTYEGTLLSYAESTAGVRDGIADVAYTVPAYTRAEFPNTNLVVDMATASDDPVVMAAASTEFMYTCAPCMKEYQDQNTVFMGFAVIGPYYLMSVDKITEMSDFQGKTLRGFGPFGRWVDAMGSTSVVIGATDIFESMSQGQLDGNTHTLDTLKSLSIGEVADYILDAPIGLYLGNAMFNTNRDLWEELTPEQKKGFLMAASDSIAWATVDYFKVNASYLENPESVGVEVVQPSAEVAEATAKFRKEDLETVAQLNIDKYGIADAQEQVERMKGLVKKWAEIFADVDTTDPAAVQAVFAEQLFGQVDPSAI